MDINSWFQQNVRADGMCRPVVCMDGFHMSVQASRTHYCTPRVTGAHAYEAFEVGFPSAKEELLMAYAEDPSAPTDTVYGWVPTDVVDAVIKKHGGIE